MGLAPRTMARHAGCYGLSFWRPWWGAGAITNPDFGNHKLGSKKLITVYHSITYSWRSFFFFGKHLGVFGDVVEKPVGS